jgi:hypothetical protein
MKYEELSIEDLVVEIRGGLEDINDAESVTSKPDRGIRRDAGWGRANDALHELANRILSTGAGSGSVEEIERLRKICDGYLLTIRNLALASCAVCGASGDEQIVVLGRNLRDKTTTAQEALADAALTPKEGQGERFALFTGPGGMSVTSIEFAERPGNGLQEGEHYRVLVPLAALSKTEWVSGEVGHYAGSTLGRFIPIKADWPVGTKVEYRRIPTPPGEKTI